MKFVSAVCQNDHYSLYARKHTEMLFLLILYEFIFGIINTYEK